MLWFSENKKFLFALFSLLLLFGVAFYVFPIIRDRYFPSSQKSSSEDSGSSGSETASQETDEEENHSVSSSETADGTNSEESSESVDTTSSGTEEEIGSVNIDTNERDGDEGVFASITNYHCSSGCEAFANNFQYLEYCQQVCGILEVKDVSESDCKKKDGLEAEYCYKDLAINKLDASFCNKIDDGNIFTTCKTRILQEVLEK